MPERTAGHAASSVREQHNQSLTVEPGGFEDRSQTSQGARRMWNISDWKRSARKRSPDSGTCRLSSKPEANAFCPLHYDETNHRHSLHVYATGRAHVERSGFG